MARTKEGSSTTKAPVPTADVRIVAVNAATMSGLDRHLVHLIVYLSRSEQRCNVE